MTCEEEADSGTFPSFTNHLYFGPRVEEVALGIFPTFLVTKNPNQELRDLVKCAKKLD